MGIVSLIIVYMLLRFDLSLLKRRSQQVYNLAMVITNHEAILYWVLMIFASGITYWQGHSYFGLVFGALFVIYLFKRKEFFDRFHSEVSSEGILQEDHLGLALRTLPMMGWWFVSLSILQALLYIYFKIWHQSSDDLTMILIFSEVSSIVLIFLIYQSVKKFKSLRFFEVLGLQTQGLNGLQIWIYPAIIAIGYALISALILGTRPVQPMTPLQELLSSTSSIGVMIFFVATAILTAPFFEEIIFRGFFFYVIKPIKGVIFAILFVALTFALLHVEQYRGDWAAIAVVSCFGLGLTILRAWTQSAIPGMVAHYAYNTTLIVVPIVMTITANPLYWDYQLNAPELNFQQKEQRLLKSIEIYPRFAEAYNELAWIYSEQNAKLDQALTFINDALTLDPDNYAYLDTKAEVLYKMGRKAECLMIAEQLVRKHPQNDYLKKQLEKFKNKK